MARSIRIRKVIGLLTLVLPFLLACPFAVSAQNIGPDNQEYSFELDTDLELSEAKVVLEALSMDNRIIDYRFIPECTCFKVSSNEVLQYEDLETIIRTAEVHINGKVMTSAGEVLFPQRENPEAEE